VRSASEVEQNIVSVERILHQIQVPSEAPSEIPETKPNQSWPSQGAVEFWCVTELKCLLCFKFHLCSQYSTRYRPELDLVLKDISMSIVCYIPLLPLTAY